MGSDIAGTGWARTNWAEASRRTAEPAATGSIAVTRPRSYAHAVDAELVSWSAEGDRRAFDEIVCRHGPFALRVASRLVSDMPAAEDVVQEALVRAWSQAGRFDPERARFTTWLYRIIVNLAIDHCRRVQPEPLPEDFDLVDPAVGADEVVAANQRRAAVAGALRTLPPRQRAAMILVYDEGLTGAEAARILGLTAKAVERLLARARAGMHDRLQLLHGRKES